MICTIKGEGIWGKMWRFSVQEWRYSFTHVMSWQGVYYTQYFPICHVHSCRKKLVPLVNVALIFGGCFYLKNKGTEYSVAVRHAGLLFIWRAHSEQLQNSSSVKEIKTCRKHSEFRHLFLLHLLNCLQFLPWSWQNNNKYQGKKKFICIYFISYLF